MCLNREIIPANWTSKVLFFWGFSYLVLVMGWLVFPPNLYAEVLTQQIHMLKSDIIWYDMTWHDSNLLGRERMDRQRLGLETQRPTRRFVSEEWVQLQVRENTSKISLDIESFVFSCLVRSPEGGSCWHCFRWLSSSTFVRVLGFNPVIL